jgi:hypothetical protein
MLGTSSLKAVVMRCGGWKREWIAAWAVLCVGGLPAWAQQEQDGVVRISDGKPSVIQPVGHGKSHAMKSHGGVYVDGGAMTTGDCPHCHGAGAGTGCPHCRGWGHGSHCHGKHCLSGKFGEHYCKHSPDHGYSIPSKYPIQRRGVQYTSYFPSQWYGADGPAPVSPIAYPMAYMPTDTTQLGYYYQHVPFWQPQPNPLPAMPHPAQWHNYATSPNPWNFTGGGWGGAGCPSGFCPTTGYSDGMMMESSPAGMPPAPNPTPATAPTPLQPVPPQPPYEAAPAPVPSQEVPVPTTAPTPVPAPVPAPPPVE